MIEIFHYGLIRYYNNDGRQHRANGLPSTIWANGIDREYRIKGLRHRPGNLPANIYLEFDEHDYRRIIKEYWKDGCRTFIKIDKVDNDRD